MLKDSESPNCRACEASHLRNNWFFTGSLRAGQRAAAVTSLIQSAKINWHDPYAYMKDILTWLPTQKNSQIEDLLQDEVLCST